MLTCKPERRSRFAKKPWYRWFALTCLSLTFGVLLARPSHAQLKPSIQKIDQTQIRRKTERRAANNFPYWISYNDCIADDVLTFKVQIMNPSVNNFEVWAGKQDCSQLAERQGNLSQCWQVYSSQVTRSPATIPIRAQDIVAQNGPKDGRNGVPGQAKDCNNRVYRDIKLYFMYVNDGNEVSSNVVTFNDTGIDLEGPITPSLEKLLPSDDSLIAQWENTDTTMFAGYRLYCADGVAPDDVSTGSTASSSTAATTTSTESIDNSLDAAVDAVFDAGLALADAATTSSDEPTTPTVVAGCGGSVLQQGAYPTDDLKICGTVDSYSARSGNATGLRNGRNYAVAVTAIDRLGNESALSNVRCNIPREVYTFYEDYRSAGGEGGGGFCTIGAPGRSRFTLSSLLLVASGLVLAYSRRKFLS